MLKKLLLSGWFCVQPFSRYIAFLILIAPLLAASAHSTSAQPQYSKNTYITEKLGSVLVEISTVDASDSTQVSKVSQIKSLTNTSAYGRVDRLAAVQPQILQVDKIESWTVEDYSLSITEVADNNPLVAVELAPVVTLKGLSTNQLELAAKIKTAKIKSLAVKNSYVSMDVPVAESSEAANIVPITRESQPEFKEVPVVDQPDETQLAQQDPIGSSYPIPWNWILTTHQAISSNNGSGVRYYRSVPVVSPDGRYAIYSRVQLEVKPELYNSRVSSVLFVEDKQTGKLRVVSSTSRNMDTLLNAKTSEDANGEGTIGVLVPVSWSQKGDRFLARKFEAVFNTSDASDRAVIWNQQNNHTHIVTPTYQEKEHEKIAVLLGWSQTQPDNVLFRAGEMGEEEWPILAVSHDGKTAIAADIDQPVTFGKKVTQVWAGPQVAYR